MAQKLLDTDELSDKYRAIAVRPAEGQLLVTNFVGTEQEKDLSEPPNCRGLGRVRHFRRTKASGWPANPLPIDPASRALGLHSTDQLRAQVFQNAVCNWRCWYCYVPFGLLSASPKHSRWVTASELIDAYLEEQDPPPMIDLSGGQPDLVPEWVPWVMEELRRRGLERQIYLWSDDNVSNDFFWRYLTEPQRELVATYPMYGRVCCFKGFDEESFSFNTAASPELFERQFDLAGRLIRLGIDLYGYVTLTTPSRGAIVDGVRRFIDGLQALHPNLPLRIVPLQIEVFTPVESRLDDERREAMVNQWAAVEAWQMELEVRFTAAERERSIVDVPLNARRGAR